MNGKKPSFGYYKFISTYHSYRGATGVFYSPRWLSKVKISHSMSNQQGVRPWPTQIFFKFATLVDLHDTNWMAPVLPLKVEQFLSYKLLTFAKNMNFRWYWQSLKLITPVFLNQKAYLYAILKYLDKSKMYHIYFFILGQIRQVDWPLLYSKLSPLHQELSPSKLREKGTSRRTVVIFSTGNFLPK